MSISIKVFDGDRYVGDLVSGQIPTQVSPASAPIAYMNPQSTLQDALLALIDNSKTQNSGFNGYGIASDLSMHRSQWLSIWPEFADTVAYYGANLNGQPRLKELYIKFAKGTGANAVLAQLATKWGAKIVFPSDGASVRKACQPHEAVIQLTW
jgi:hypothetical protein